MGSAPEVVSPLDAVLDRPINQIDPQILDALRQTEEELLAVFNAANIGRDPTIYQGSMDAAIEAKLQSILHFFLLFERVMLSSMQDQEQGKWPKGLRKYIVILAQES